MNHGGFYFISENNFKTNLKVFEMCYSIIIQRNKGEIKYVYLQNY